MNSCDIARNVQTYKKRSALVLLCTYLKVHTSAQGEISYVHKLSNMNQLKHVYQ